LQAEGRTYRYFRKEPLYPFGFGLSYSSFSYSDISVGGRLAEGGEVAVSATLTNIGDSKGAEAAQLYVVPHNAPFDVPWAELRGLSRVELAPGESRRLEFILSDEDLMLFDSDGRKVRLVGNWQIEIGGCSPRGRRVELGAAEPVIAELIVY
jgi:beta-glucosidase